MKNFKDYEDLIRNKVKEINDKDPRWDWKIKHLDESLVCIQWGYLVYCEEKYNYFRLRLTENDMGEGFITARNPYDDMIDGHFASDDPLVSWQESWESAIIRSIEELASYAHSRY